MSDIGKDSPQPTVAKDTRPWWLKQIMDFDGLEITPCKFFGFNQAGREIVKPCRPEQVSLWTVYGHYHPSGRNHTLVALDDFDTKGEAQKFYHRLIDHYPHLAGFRARIRPPSHDQPAPH